ncbi:MAG: FG-GAP-like repeat-containing protein [Balneolaceae bacterium]
MFESLSTVQTGIDFINNLEEQPGNNILESDFFYNGGGVAVGDINNDGLPDIYFTANQGENALYLNQSDYKFQNITLQAGISDSTGWTAGTAMVDINGDGLLDIYVCKAGKEDPENRRNKLFINNGDLTFAEKAAEFGLNDPGYCTQAVFLDYNNNGLLDVFLVNYNTKHFQGFNRQTIRNEIAPYAGDRLYRNNGDGTFTDVSEEAQIHQNPLGFGLSATVSDLNGDGWPDIYVTNDFIERDYMYINQGDGTFKDEIQARTDVVSYFSMGSDIADINNDGLPDILVVDMLPPEYSRESIFLAPDYSIYEELAADGFHRQNMRNTLQLNNGEGVFSEIGQLSGISKTDWSWASLIADFDNDGHKDIYITNGFPRFYTNLDYLNDIFWEQYPDEALPPNPELVYDLVQQMEKVEMHNFAFQNTGNLGFKDVTSGWGLKNYSVSSGAVYADLNNTGFLDLIVTNINEPASVFKNTGKDNGDNHFLKVQLNGEDGNTFGIGSKVKLIAKDGSVNFQEVFQTRGFQSTVEPVLHFGLGFAERVDIEILWPDQSRQWIENVNANQKITVNKNSSETENVWQSKESSKPMFAPIDEQSIGLSYKHQGSYKADQMFEPFMPHTLTNLGPPIAISDINNDGLDDFFIGGGQDQAAKLYLQQTNGTFVEIQTRDFGNHRVYQDIDAIFFDANGNGHPDLYVVSGGNFEPANDSAYQDRLYLNDGFGNFTYDSEALPEMHVSGGTVTVVNVDKNNSPDLFVGGRVVTGQYPSAPRSFLLQNEGGTFKDVTSEVAPELMNPGLVTDAHWADIDNDTHNELIITGEWMPIRIFKTLQNEENIGFREITEQSGLKNTAGWWNVLKVRDINGDGALDLIAGNRGLNTDLNATPENPVILYYGDFNNNGLLDPVMTSGIAGKRYPVLKRDQILQEFSNLRQNFPDYESWASATIEDIIPSEQLEEAEKLYVHTFSSSVFINDGDGIFEQNSLPNEAQTSPIHDMVINDFFGLNSLGILAVGNNFGNRPETGPLAAKGVLLKLEEDDRFTTFMSHQTGFYASGDIRSMEWVPTSRGPLILLARNGESILSYIYQSKGLEE